MEWLVAGVVVPLIVVPLGAWVNHVFKRFDRENTRQHDVNKAVLDEALATAQRTEKAVCEVRDFAVAADTRATDRLNEHMRRDHVPAVKVEVTNGQLAG